MPTYAYRCTACTHQFEQTQRFSDDPLRECPACGGLVRRVIQPVGVVFKGSGWYITDSRKPAADGVKTDDKVAATSDGNGAEAPAKKTEPETTKTAAGATSDVKPAATTPTTKSAAAV